MGFLKFLQKKGPEKANPELEEHLDVPPPMPAKGHMPMPELHAPETTPTPNLHQEHPSFSQPKTVYEQPLPPKNQPSPEEARKLSEIPLEQAVEEKRNMADIIRSVKERAERDIPEMPPLEAGNESDFDALEKRYVADFQKEKQLTRHHDVPSGFLFVRLDRYKDSLASVNSMRSTLKQADDSIGKMAEIHEHSEKVFDKWHNTLLDLQKNIIFIDKTLFNKG